MLRTIPLWIACVGLTGPALAKKPPQDVITEHTVKARDFETRERAQVVNHEVGTLRAWLGEAQAYLAQDEEELLARALARMKAQTMLIEALLARAEAEEKARTAHAEADTREKEAGKMRNAAFAVEQELAELERRTAEKTGGAQATESSP